MGIIELSRAAMNGAPKVLCAYALLCCGVALAQDTSFAREYMRRLKMYQTVQPVGETPFGENINLYTGELSFRHMDVELPGLGPTIVIAREYSPQSMYVNGVGTLADWALSIPRIETYLSPSSPSIDGTSLGIVAGDWQTETSYTDHSPTPLRCSHFNWPYDFEDAQMLWWQGYELIDERSQRQFLLARNSAYTAKPQLTIGGATVSFPVVTQDKWQIGCLPKLSNPGATTAHGEGFIALSPDGTRYYFDYLVSAPATQVLERDPFATRAIKHKRRRGVLYVSRIEDRFGNAIRYGYVGDKLTRIWSENDTREVTFQWWPDNTAHVITSFTIQPNQANPRIWKFTYNGRLKTVELPDHSTWQFELGASPGPLTRTSNTCATRTTSFTTSYASATSVSVKAPSGLTGVFTLAGTYHGRSYVPSECRADPVSQEYVEDNYPIFDNPSLVSKTLSGIGLPTQTWTYVYSPVAASTTSDACAQNSTCPSSRWVDVTDPVGNRVRHTLSTRWGALEGKALKIETFAAGETSPLRTESFEYDYPQSGPYPAALGSMQQSDYTNTIKSQIWTPLKRKLMTQQGRTFEWKATAFDAFANAKTIVRSTTTDTTIPPGTQVPGGPPPPPPVTGDHPPPSYLHGYTEIDNSELPPEVAYEIFWTGNPGATYYQVLKGAQTLYSGPALDFTDYGRDPDRDVSYWVRSCYADGQCSEWLGPLTL